MTRRATPRRQPSRANRPPTPRRQQAEHVLRQVPEGCDRRVQPHNLRQPPLSFRPGDQRRGLCRPQVTAPVAELDEQPASTPQQAGPAEQPAPHHHRAPAPGTGTGTGTYVLGQAPGALRSPGFDPHDLRRRAQLLPRNTRHRPRAGGRLVLRGCRDGVRAMAEGCGHVSGLDEHPVRNDAARVNRASSAIAVEPPCERAWAHETARIGDHLLTRSSVGREHRAVDDWPFQGRNDDGALLFTSPLMSG